MHIVFYFSLMVVIADRFEASSSDRPTSTTVSTVCLLSIRTIVERPGVLIREVTRTTRFVVHSSPDIVQLPKECTRIGDAGWFRASEDFHGPCEVTSKSPVSFPVLTRWAYVSVCVSLCMYAYV